MLTFLFRKYYSVEKNSLESLIQRAKGKYFRWTILLTGTTSQSMAWATNLDHQRLVVALKELTKREKLDPDDYRIRYEDGLGYGYLVYGDLKKILTSGRKKTH